LIYTAVHLHSADESFRNFQKLRQLLYRLARNRTVLLNMDSRKTITFQWLLKRNKEYSSSIVLKEGATYEEEVKGLPKKSKMKM